MDILQQNNLLAQRNRGWFEANDIAKGAMLADLPTVPVE